MLNILLMIILLIIILIFIILLIGIRLKVRWMKIGSDYDGCLEILIFKKLKVYTMDFKSEDDAGEEESDDESKRDFKEIYKLAKPCFKYFKKFLKDALKAVNINGLENHLVIGFSSFAKTGEYIGYIWTIFSVLTSILPNSRLSAEPSFTGEVLNLKGHLNIDISPLKLVVPIVKLISKKEVRALIKGVRNGNA